MEIPKDISVEVVQNTTINLKSCDKELLGLFASNIRAWRNLNLIKEKVFYIKMSKLFVKLVNLQNKEILI
jgi:ribosomal protein L6P/L9E